MNGIIYEIAPKHTNQEPTNSMAAIKRICDTIKLTYWTKLNDILYIGRNGKKKER